MNCSQQWYHSVPNELCFHHEAVIQALAFLQHQCQPVPVSSDCHARRRDKRLWRNLWWRIIKQQKSGVRTRSSSTVTQILCMRAKPPSSAAEVSRGTLRQLWAKKKFFKIKMQSCRQTWGNKKTLKFFFGGGGRLQKWITEGAQRIEEKGPNVNVFDRLRGYRGFRSLPLKKVNKEIHVGLILFKRKVLLVTDLLIYFFPFFFFLFLNSSHTWWLHYSPLAHRWSKSSGGSGGGGG